MVDAILKARSGGLLVIDAEEVPDDLVRDMIEIDLFLRPALCRRSAENKAKRALKVAAKSRKVKGQNPESPKAGSTPRPRAKVISGTKTIPLTKRFTSSPH